LIAFQAHSDDDVQAVGVGLPEYCEHVEAALLAEMRDELTSVAKRTVHRDGVYAMSCHAAWWSREITFFHNLFGADVQRQGKAGPAYRSSQLVVDTATLQPVLALSGTMVSTMVPVAVSCLGAKRLAEPRSSVIGFIGAGLQARLHLTALKAFFPLARVLVHSRSKASCDALITHANALGVEASSATARETVERSQIVVSSISESYGVEPFLQLGWLRDDAFVSSVDLIRSWTGHEHAKRFLVADDPSQVATGVAEGRIPDCGSVDASLAEVLASTVAVPGVPRVLVHPGCPATLFGTTEAIRSELASRVA
jgi:ornithine cyclodeaminase/alanine dehydrogenase-like protein (mu-crystallin family)